MSRLVQSTWYTVSDGVPDSDSFILVRLDSDPTNVYRAKRINFEAARYGFLIVLINDFKLHTVPDAKVDENNAFCPSSVLEWTYLID